jgi:predicted Zn-dependent protease
MVVAEVSRKDGKTEGRKVTASPVTSFRLSVLPSFRLCLLASLVCSCVTNPATGEKQLSLVSEQEEIAMGDQTAKSTRATIGDYPDSAVQRYVRALGARLAAGTERPGLPWSFEVIDDPEVNAFAAPGGRIFVTRGILPYLDSEAELAGVLGHECGHVTARHTAQQVTRQQLFGLGLAAGSLLSSGIASAAGGIQQGLAVLFLSYSRGNEAQADELGFRYMRRARYDPREMSEVFRVLERVGQLSGGGKLPTWAATHPAPEDRLAKAEQRVAAVPADSLKGTLVNRDAYLRTIDGMVFGANPRQGYFEGSRFLHPDLRFRFDFPSGWKTENRTDAVVAASPQGDAMIQLSLGGRDTPEALLQKFAAQQGVETVNGQRPTVNGMAGATAEFRAKDSQGNALAGRVLYLSYEGTTYQLLGYATAARYDDYAEALRQSLRSFDRLTDPAALGRQPLHLRLVRIGSAMTIEEFYRQYPSAVKLEVIAAINGVEPGGTLKAGAWAKRVQ